MLGSETGDAQQAIASMQKHTESLQTLLTKSQESALAQFSALLAEGTQNTRNTLIVSLVMGGVMLLTLGVGSWLLIGSVFRSLGGEPEVAVTIVRSISSGDFTTAVRLQPGDNTSLLHGIETLREKLGLLIHDVRRTSLAVDSASGDISEGIDRLSSRTSEQAASLEETASSMEEMTVTVKRTADNARHAVQLATEARDQAEKGGTVATRAVGAMTEINDASRRIADIIGVISSASQQQASGLDQVNVAITSMDQSTQQNAAMAEETSAVASTMASQAKELRQLIAVFKIDERAGQVQPARATQSSSALPVAEDEVALQRVA